MKMQTTELKVEGMMCEACVGHVSKALQSVSGVRNVDVDLKAGRATVQHEGAETQTLVEAVSEEGYSAQAV
jgi:copper chaperone CopZ